MKMSAWTQGSNLDSWKSAFSMYSTRTSASWQETGHWQTGRGQVLEDGQVKQDDLATWKLPALTLGAV